MLRGAQRQWETCSSGSGVNACDCSIGCTGGVRCQERVRSGIPRHASLRTRANGGTIRRARCRPANAHSRAATCREWRRRCRTPPPCTPSRDHCGSSRRRPAAAVTRSLQRLQLRDLLRGSRRWRPRSPPTDAPLAHVLASLRQHEGMDLQRGRDRLDLHARRLTQPNCSQLILVAVLVQLSWSGSWHV